ncbi:MAG TPA: hypothetical protein VGS28_04380 [Candidatus Saccharimonadales bacterium]|nr:hypothetical protein [Candidatus Saccharimonadales bacterium]
MLGNLPLFSLYGAVVLAQFISQLPRRELLLSVTTLFGKGYKPGRVARYVAAFPLFYGLVVWLGAWGITWLFAMTRWQSTYATMFLGIFSVIVGLWECAIVWFGRPFGLHHLRSVDRLLYKNLQSQLPRLGIVWWVGLNGLLVGLLTILPTLDLFRILSLPSDNRGMKIAIIYALISIVPLVYLLVHSLMRGQLVLLRRHMDRFKITSHLLYGCLLIILGWCVLLTVTNSLSFGVLP